jgi:DNA-binding response OmpR family regulator
MYVLLIEPDRILAATYQRALQSQGHKVTSAVSAQEAIYAADQQKPDVVVLEIDLPRHNGVEFLYEFRSYNEWLKVPVIIHSFVPSTEFTRAATLQKELGVVRVLYKPATNLAQLCAAVRTVQPVAQQV